MIRLPAPVLPGAAGVAEQRHLRFLTELARLIPVTDPSADVVRIEVTDRFSSISLRDWRGAGWGIEAGDGVVRVARAGLDLVGEVASASAEVRPLRATGSTGCPRRPMP